MGPLILKPPIEQSSDDKVVSVPERPTRRDRPAPMPRPKSITRPQPRPPLRR